MTTTYRQQLENKYGTKAFGALLEPWESDKLYAEEEVQPLTKQSVIAFYLEYVNNFLTIARMAEYYEMPTEDCEYLVGLGKKYFNDK